MLKLEFKFCSTKVCLKINYLKVFQQTSFQKNFNKRGDFKEKLVQAYLFKKGWIILIYILYNNNL